MRAGVRYTGDWSGQYDLVHFGDGLGKVLWAKKYSSHTTMSVSQFILSVLIRTPFAHVRTDAHIEQALKLASCLLQIIL